MVCGVVLTIANPAAASHKQVSCNNSGIRIMCHCYLFFVLQKKCDDDWLPANCADAGPTRGDRHTIPYPDPSGASEPRNYLT